MARSLFSMLWNVKVSLQFTGWLQYAPNALVTGLYHLLLPSRYSWITKILSLNLLFDIFSCKLQLVSFLEIPSTKIPSLKKDEDVNSLLLSRKSCRSFQNLHLSPAHHEDLLSAVEEYTSTRELLDSSSPSIRNFVSNLSNLL
jgi:hypothetical protein